MQKDERDVLDVLKFELEFLTKGGYGRAPREPWRPAFIFEDSPTCMNYDCKNDPAPCRDCVLMQLVPQALRFGKQPCRQISLNAEGETLDSMYRYSEQHEIEQALRNWLVVTIAQLEQMRKDLRTNGGERLTAGSGTVKGTALHQSLHPKCANPACPTAFHWLEGGKFFRFHNGEAAPVSNATDLAGNLHKVTHFWLCENCSRVFTLVHDAELGIVLKLLRLELPVREARKELPSARQN
jgi:hypothetical protein